MSEVEVLEIPIVAYPPFKLRSSLIDKDPVIWVHLIEYYIRLFQKLISIYSRKDVKLSLKSQQQLTIFLRIYLHETAEESSKIFSLGSINPDIVKNSKILKLYVFEFIKSTNLINLNLTGESIWNFIEIYTKLAHMNQSQKNFPVTINLVRNLIEGSVKSKINSKSNDVSLIGILHKHLKNLIESGKFSKHDLEAFSLILGQYVQSIGNSDVRRIGNHKSKNISTKDKGNSAFAEKFVTGTWLETVEVLYNKGTTVHHKTAFQVGVISVLSLPTIKLSKLISVDLNINNFKALIRLFPLLSTIILSPAYLKLNPGLEKRLPFLSKEGRKQSQGVTDSTFNENDLKTILDMFPQITELQAKKLLLDNNMNLEAVTSILVELSPTEFQELGDYKETKKSVYDGDDISKLKFEKSRVIYGKKDQSKESFNEEDLKKKTLTAALRLLYESDEDEPDDTYDDQEVTAGDPAVPSDDLDLEEPGAGLGRASTKPSSKLNQVEHILFEVYKKSPDVLERSARKSNNRNALKDKIKWSDEQIEGWARMLLKQPAKFRMLDEAYNFGGISQNNRSLKQSTSYRKPATDTAASNDDDVTALVSERKSARPPRQTAIKMEKNEEVEGDNSEKKKHTDARKKQIDAKKKASRANHNRKSGHDKKMAKGFA